MTPIDWTLLGITELIVALLVAGTISGLLAWRLPMAPLSSAVIAGGVAAGLVLVFGRAYPAAIVLAGGMGAALAGLLYDRAILPQPGLVLAEAGIAAVTAGFAIPLHLLAGTFVGDMPGPVVAGAVAGVVALFSLALRRWDRLPGLSAATAAAVAAGVTLFGVWRGVAASQSIWWLAALGALGIGFAVISRARATPLGAAGTSYLALTIGVLAGIVVAVSGWAGPN